jgi:hypothetical protein
MSDVWNSPQQIFERFEKGELEREEVHHLMALHAREIIEEMVEDRQNPLAALLENRRARRAAKRLAREHGSGVLRGILVALTRLPDFPPARYLWNAEHPDVPLHCFFRMQREPVFRIREIRRIGDRLEVHLEHGSRSRNRAERRIFILNRSIDFEWRVVS